MAPDATTPRGSGARTGKLLVSTNAKRTIVWFNGETLLRETR